MSPIDSLSYRLLGQGLSKEKVLAIEEHIKMTLQERHLSFDDIYIESSIKWRRLSIEVKLRNPPPSLEIHAQQIET